MKKLTVFIVLMTVFISSMKADIVVVNGLAYIFDDTNQTASVTGAGGLVDLYYAGDIVIPETVDYAGVTYKVTGIDDGSFRYCYDLHSVTIPGSVTSIGDEVFANCHGLESVKIPGSVTSIGKYSFHGTNLKSIDLPELSVISEGLLSNCKGLTSITIPESVTTIGEVAFADCSSLTSISIPEQVRSLGAYVFQDDTSLVSVELPESLNRINKDTFRGCKNLSSIKLPAALKVISDYAFSGCQGLGSLEFPEALTSIGTSAFEKCTGLKHLIFHGKLEKAGANSFTDCRIENVVVFSQYPRYSINDANFPNAFSERTLRHATLYVPTGELMDFVYNTQWYLFFNIREAALTVSGLSQAKAFKLMDAHTFGFVVYDPVNNEMIMTESRSLDESDSNISWQIVERDGGKCLYNIGAKKYLVFGSDGSMTLTSVPTALEMRDIGNGIAIGEGTSRPWYFVLNDNVMVDNSVTAIDAVSAMDSSPVDYYSTDGRHIQVPGKGITIIRMKDGSVRKIIR